MSDALPEGWMEVELPAVVNLIMGQSPPSNTYNTEGKGLPFFQGKAEFGDIYPTPVKYCSNPSKVADRDDILISVRAPVGPTNLCQEKACIGRGLAAIQPLGKIPSRYLFYYLRSIEDWLSKQGTGSTFTAISKTDLEQLTVCLAPLPEQRRIVAKLETLLGKVDACQKRLAKVSILLKRFRQSVLSAACSGRLTADWREENPDVESANDLLIRIKERRVVSAKSKKEQMQIAEAFEECNLRLDSGEIGLDDIPNTWVACRVGAIGTVCNGSTPPRKETRFWGGNIPWVSSGEVRNNIISETRECITNAGYESCSVKLLPCGTLLLAMIGEGKTRGQSAVLAIEATINQNIAAIILEHGLVRPGYLWRWFQMQYEATRERGSGSGPQALNCQRVRELPFVLAPLTEQREIVRRVEALFALADRIEARFVKAKAQVDRLASSLLAKAFRGELVPTEAALARAEGRDYEPASVLLKRIRAERASERPASAPRCRPKRRTNNR